MRLVRMGAFIRAYDWSAWLLKRYGSPLNAGLDTGDSDAHVFVGFPVASIEKFTPEGCETKKDGEGITEESIFPAAKFPPEAKYGLLEDEYSKWLSETVAALCSHSVRGVVSIRTADCALRVLFAFLPRPFVADM